MKAILIVGGGGREHAFGWALAKSPGVKIFTAPGNAGTARIGTNVKIDIEDIPALVEFASSQGIDLTVVGPEVPLAKGIVNTFAEQNLPIFGPTQQAAQIEASKVWAREFMAHYGIPQPEFATFDNYSAAKAYLENYSKPCVVKADGLAAGKGVIVCETSQEAQDALRRIMVDREFGSAGDKVLVEEKLLGREVSVLAVTDGKTVLPLLPAEDYKQVFDADQGPNTGGMGGVCPHWEVVDPEMLRMITEKILIPTVEGMAIEGRPYKGILYAGLMITNQGPKVLEFNCRGGDPETQVILPLLQTPLLLILEAAIEGRLKDISIKWKRGFCVGVVLASGGYPGNYEKGMEISGLETVEKKQNILVFEAGTKQENGKVVTSGGRVLIVVGLGKNIEKAADKAYAQIGKIGFLGVHYRTDIGQRGKSRY